MKLDAEALAAAYGISRQHLYRIVRKVSGWDKEYRLQLWRIANDEYQ